MSDIDQKDLRAAVGSGLLTEVQAVGLLALAQSRQGMRENLDPGDEPFELFRGFNEIFIVIGLSILATGWWMVAGLNFRSAAGGAMGMTLLGAAVFWVLSEYFIRRRMVAPAIALTILWTLNAAFGLFATMAEPFMIAQRQYDSLPPVIMLTISAVAIYWARFRVPFAMALMALGVFGVAVLLTAIRAGNPQTFAEFFMLSSDGPFAWVTLLVGLLVFATAMWFDTSDPHRVTRRSAQGFWLHLVAAPALVNTIALSLLDKGSTDARLLLLGCLLLFALIAIIIDRRSFLIAAIGYSVVLSATVANGDGVALIILLLGVFLVALGAFWTAIRARVMAPLSGILPVNRLPPYH